MVSTAMRQRHPLVRHYPVGASTGYMNYRHDWPKLVEEAYDVASLAIELAALSEDELPGLIEYLNGSPDLPFRYVSVHAPSKRMTMPEQDLVAMLVALPPVVEAIIVHPDVVKDPRSYAPLGRRLVIENMDARKEDGRTADELRKYFEALPEAGLCFDIAHACSIDESMEEGNRILDAYTSRLRQVHLSSLDDDSHHIPLCAVDERRFAPLLHRCRDVPWILEAPLPDA